jgi:hypothetical protein
VILAEEDGGALGYLVRVFDSVWLTTGASPLQIAQIDSGKSAVYGYLVDALEAYLDPADGSGVAHLYRVYRGPCDAQYCEGRIRTDELDVSCATR